MKVFMIHTLNAGTAWYRINEHAIALSNIEGIEVRMNHYDPTNLMGAWWEPQLITKEILDEFLYQFETWGPDVIVAQKFFSIEGLAFFQTCKDFWPMLTEVDDDFINVPCWNPAFSPQANGHYVAAMQLMESSAIVSSTPHLLGMLTEKYNPKGYCIPNGIDIKFWDDLPKADKHSGVRIGWAGATSHREDIEILLDVIPEVNKRFSNIQWAFMGGTAGLPEDLLKMDNVLLFKEWWPTNEYPRALKLKGFDIGLAPLRFHPFNLAKSNLRWLEYTACGIPTVASNIGHFKETLKHNEDVLLCDMPEQWIEGLCRLIESETLRKQIALNAKDSLIRDWDINKIAVKYAEILRQEVKLNEKAN